MPRGKFVKDPIPLFDQFVKVNDEKLKLTLAALVDKHDEQVRSFIYRCYNDPVLMQLYTRIRNSGMYEKSGANRRKLVEFPNGYVFDFCDTVMTELYGEDWLRKNKALNHDLVRPWLVVRKL